MSFSALGPGDERSATPLVMSQSLYNAQPPPAPKPDTHHLPLVSPPVDASNAGVPPYDFDSPVVGSKASRRASKLFPDAMIKLAPPADDECEIYAQPHAQATQHVHEVRLDDNVAVETPRRVPGVSLDLNVDEASPGSPSGASVTRSRSDGAKKSQNRRSMGPPPKPKRASTAYPGQLPTVSTRMEPSRSADSRARMRNAMPGRSQTYSPHPHHPISAPGSLSRGVVDPSSRSNPSSRPFPLTDPIKAEPPDMGGPDGLEAKVVLLGSQGVGKTSLILRYTTRAFTSNAAPATIGSSLHTRKLVHSGVRVKLQIWDTAGQERFRSMAPIYYRGAHVCVLVYDITDRQSFDDVRSWLEELGRTVPKETAIFVVGAKTDLAESRGRAVS